MSEKLILASTSQFRQAMLKAAGLTFEAVAPDIDERSAEAPLKDSGASPGEIAQILAEAKAIAVSERFPDALVLGCDQTLSLGDEVLHKPADMEEARRRLLALSGQTHQLNSAAVLARNGQVIWRHVGEARLTMRDLDPTFVGRHLAAVGDKVLSSVGAYQIEGQGIQLFEKIDGDHFTIVGLPLLAVLDELRKLKAIDG
ncbi:Maf-like protein [Escherichia coli]|nr:Maf-like protein [Salmonella enterica subsp. enterica serovar Virchow]EBW2353055.1 Maf-like protein [Salmonella enterica subsp. enterica serovar Enteritidis]ECI7685655.1 Maf-like protein [Salmonella enterica subsp. enterica serovar Paratyphi A]EFG2586795.1 Maf-like protein [Escherichia coli]EFG2885778.1 Maf-like protein [Escherichia coli]